MYKDVTFDPVNVDADKIPEPETTLHKAVVALPPITPDKLIGVVNRLFGSQTSKSAGNVHRTSKNGY